MQYLHGRSPPKRRNHDGDCTWNILNQKKKVRGSVFEACTFKSTIINISRRSSGKSCGGLLTQYRTDEPNPARVRYFRNRKPWVLSAEISFSIYSRQRFFAKFPAAPSSHRKLHLFSGLRVFRSEIKTKVLAPRVRAQRGSKVQLGSSVF